ncbi:MAG: IclR family transcriptional regulator [Blastomonas sp.]
MAGRKDQDIGAGGEIGVANPVQSRRRVQSIEVGFRVLRVLRMAEGALPLREIAARVNMPPSKVHLYLVSFVRENMAYQDLKNGYYGLGSFAIQLGLAAIRQLDVVSLASDVLTDLRDRTDCAIYLSLWGDQGPCIVAKADGALQGAFSLRLGYILPLTTTATGHVFLAHLPENETEEIMAGYGNLSQMPTPKRRKPKSEIDAIIAEVRARGYGSTIGKLNQNFAGISVPIFDAEGQIAAAMTLLGPTDFVTGDRLDKYCGLLVDAGTSVTQRIAEESARIAAQQ